MASRRKMGKRLGKKTGKRMRKGTKRFSRKMKGGTLIGTELYNLLQKRLKCGTSGRMYGKNTCNIGDLDNQIDTYLKSPEAKNLSEGDLIEITDSVFKDNTGTKVVPKFIDEVNKLKNNTSSKLSTPWVKQSDLQKNFELKKIIKLLEERNNDLKKVYNDLTTENGSTVRRNDIMDYSLDPLILSSIIAYTKLYISNDKTNTTNEYYIKSFLDNTDADVDINTVLMQLKELIKTVAEIYNKVLTEFNENIDEGHQYTYVPPLYELVDNTEAINSVELVETKKQIPAPDNLLLLEAQKNYQERPIQSQYEIDNNKVEVAKNARNARIHIAPSVIKSNEESLKKARQEYQASQLAQAPQLDLDLSQKSNLTISGGKTKSKKNKSKRNKGKRNKTRRKHSKRRK